MRGMAGGKEPYSWAAALLCAVLFTAGCALIAEVAAAQTGPAPPLEARLEWAHALLESGRKTEALAAFQQLQADQPANPAVQFGLAAALLETGSVEDSVSLLERLKALDPKDVATRAYLARAYMLAKAADPARSELEAVRRLSPYADLLHAQLVEWCYEVALGRPQFEQAGHGQSGAGDLARDQIGYFLTLPTSDELRGRVEYLQGVLAYRQGRFADALEALGRAVESSPHHEPYWIALLSAEGASDIAGVDPDSLEKALSRFPKSPVLLSLFALREIRYERLDHAREIEQRIRKYAPNDPAAGLVLGRLELESLRFEEAAAAFEAVLSRAPRDHRAHCGQGVALARLGRAEAALQRFEEALAIEPFDGESLYEKARLLADLERTAEAAEALAPLLDRDPAHQRAAYLMFRLQTKLGNPAAASRWREAFLSARRDGSR